MDMHPDLFWHFPWFAGTGLKSSRLEAEILFLSPFSRQNSSIKMFFVLFCLFGFICVQQLYGCNARKQKPYWRGFIWGLLPPHKNYFLQKENYSIYLNTVIILVPLLDSSWKLSLDQHVASIVSQTTICCLLLFKQKYLSNSGELLNSYPSFSRVSKTQKSKSLFT